MDSINVRFKMFYYSRNMWDQVKIEFWNFNWSLTKNQALLFSSQIKYFDIS